VSYDRTVRYRLAVIAGIAFLFVLLLIFFGTKTKPSATDASVDVASEALETAPLVETTVESSAPDSDVIPTAYTIIYTPAATSGLFSLEGIDVDRRRAWVRRSATEPKLLFEISTIDYEKSPVAIDSWSCNDSNVPPWSARAPDFHPMSGALDADVARYAEIARATPRRTLAPTFAASADRVVYAAASAEKEGATWLMSATKDGKDPKRIDAGLLTSDAPVIAADGKHVAFRGCPKDPCGFYVYSANIGANPVKTGIPSDALAPWMSPDGKTVYAFARGAKDAGGCLWRAEVEHPEKASKVHCLADTLSAGQAILDEHGESAVVCGSKAPDDLECAWVALPEGAFKGAARPHAMPAILSRAGLAIAAQGDVVFVDDIAAGTSARFADAALEVATARFTSDSEIVALQRFGLIYRLLRIDVRRWLAP